MDLDNARSLVRQVKSLAALKPLRTKQRRFILAYCQLGQIRQASTVSGISFPLHYKWLETDEQYKQAYEKARELFADFAEGDVFQRAFIGKEKERTKIKDGTVIIEKETIKSDILAMFALKGLKPQYRDNATFNTFVGPAKINIGTPSLQQTTVIDVTDDSQKLP